jgi:DNA-binding transcriptional LysR family regulator
MFELYSAVRSGIGVLVLPTYLANSDVVLIRVGEPIKELAVYLWMPTHADLRA